MLTKSLSHECNIHVQRFLRSILKEDGATTIRHTDEMRSNSVWYTIHHIMDLAIRHDDRFDEIDGPQFPEAWKMADELLRIAKAAGIN